MGIKGTEITSKEQIRQISRDMAKKVCKKLKLNLPTPQDGESPKCDYPCKGCSSYSELIYSNLNKLKATPCGEKDCIAWLKWQALIQPKGELTISGESDEFIQWIDRESELARAKLPKGDSEVREKIAKIVRNSIKKSANGMNRAVSVEGHQGTTLWFDRTPLADQLLALIQPKGDEDICDNYGHECQQLALTRQDTLHDMKLVTEGAKLLTDHQIQEAVKIAGDEGYSFGLDVGRDEKDEAVKVIFDEIDTIIAQYPISYHSPSGQPMSGKDIIELAKTRHIAIAQALREKIANNLPEMSEEEIREKYPPPGTDEYPEYEVCDGCPIPEMALKAYQDKLKKWLEE